LAAVALVLLCTTAGCSRDDEVTRVRRFVQDGIQRAEKHDLAGLLALTSEGFRAEPGSRGRGAVREILGAAFYHYGRFRILYPEPAVEVAEDGRAATVTMPFLVVKRDGSWPGLESLYRDPQRWLDEVGENADLYRVIVRLAKMEEGWLAEWARLSSVGPSGFLP
jgi:hypothetical protein